MNGFHLCDRADIFHSNISSFTLWNICTISLTDNHQLYTYAYITLLYLKPMIHDPTSWMRHAVCEVGSKKLDAALGDIRYDFPSIILLLKSSYRIYHMKWHCRAYIA